MYNETYEEYIRSILGYPTGNLYNDYQDSYSRNDGYNSDYYMVADEELERYYPEIYKVVYPMVAKKCSNVRSMILTNEDLESMTDEIYYAMEGKNETRLNNNQEKEANVTDKLETRQINSSLRDLIKILLIRELLRRRRRPPMRPRPPMPPRPRPY